jgi:phosphoglycerate dehydrogenase-like enzyme
MTEFGVVAPEFLARLLHAAPPAGVDLRLVSWETGPPPAEFERADVVVPWIRDRPAVRAALPRLRPPAWVCSVSSGIDWFIGSVPEGVTVTGGQGIRSDACAEWVAAVSLYFVRGLGEFAERQREHRWEQSCFGSLAEATVLLLGYGAIGRAVERRLAPFGCRFLRVAEHGAPGVHGPSSLPALVLRADIVVVALPLGPRTAGLVDREFLAAMRRGALLVNVARGPVVDTDALIAELHRGRIRAALDVTDLEPLPPSHPLYDAPGLLLTPHIAGETSAFADRAHRFVVEQLERRAGGLPLLNPCPPPRLG